MLSRSRGGKTVVGLLSSFDKYRVQELGDAFWDWERRAVWVRKRLGKKLRSELNFWIGLLRCVTGTIKLNHN